MIDLLKLFKVHFIVASGEGKKENLQKLRFHILRQYCLLELQAGFKERVVSILHSLIEISLAKLMFPKKASEVTTLYEQFCDNEYPRIGEMKQYAGFIDYLRLKETNEEEIILVKAKSDFVREEVNC